MTQKPIQLILDFDGTLTTKDTLHLVGEVGYQRQKTDRRLHKLPPWQNIVDAYMIDYGSHANEYKPNPVDRTTLLEEAVWLDSLEVVEEASANRVISAGIFDNVTKQDIERAAEEALGNGNVKMRSEWTELLMAVYKHNAALSSEHLEHSSLQIVSVNWSRWFVWSVLWQAAISSPGLAPTDQLKDNLSHSAVYANELDSIKSDTETSSGSMPSPRGQTMVLRTAGDKLVQLHSNSDSSKGAQCPLKIYIGDSTTDLECLVMADVGICIRDREMGSGQKELAATCERIGIVVKSLSEYQKAQESASSIVEVQQRISDGRFILYYAHDHREVAQWVASTLHNPL